MNIAFPIASTALAVVTFIGGYRFAQWRAIPEYPVWRGAAIRQQAASMPAGGVLFVGDSIVDQAYFPTFCGVPVLNAGMSGATVAVLAPVALDAIKLAKPSRVLISVGINNALPKSKGVSVDDYSQQLDALVSAALNSGANVAILTQTAVRHDQSLGIDGAKLKAIDAAIKQLSRQRHIQLIDVSAALSGPDDEMPESLTIDGAHLTPLGYETWITKIQEACPSDP